MLNRNSFTLDFVDSRDCNVQQQVHQMIFEESWQRLTLPQRAVLRAIVLEGGRELLSADVRVRHRLAGTSSVQAALAALVRQDVAQKENARYVVTDSLYREWVARKTF